MTVVFTGELNDKMKGFYRSKYTGSDGEDKYAAVTQFEVLQGPVVQSVVSLTSSLRVISLTILADSTYNFLKFFAEKM